MQFRIEVMSLSHISCYCAVEVAKLLDFVKNHVVSTKTLAVIRLFKKSILNFTEKVPAGA